MSESPGVGGRGSDSFARGGRRGGRSRGSRFPHHRGSSNGTNTNNSNNTGKDKKVAKIAQPTKPVVQPVILTNKSPTVNPTIVPSTVAGTNTGTGTGTTPSTGSNTTTIKHGTNTPVVIMGDKSTRIASAPLIEPKSPCQRLSKIITENWNFQLESASKMLTENRSFLVVGVIGNQGVGKSTLLSSLYGKEKGEDSPFPMQTRDHQIMSQHCTVGVDIAVSRERLILIDTQPLFSASCLIELLKKEPPLPPECVSYEHLHELQCLQLAVFIMSVCHVVLVVQDGSAIDWKLWHFLQTVTMLKTRFPDPSELSVPTGGSQASNAIIQRQRLRNQLDKIRSTLDPHDLYHPQQEYYPDLLFVFNKSPSRLMSYSAAHTLQHTLDVFFAHHPFKTPPFLRPDVLALSQNDPEYCFGESLTIDDDITDEDGDTENDGEEVPSGAEDHPLHNNLAVDKDRLSSSPMSANLTTTPNDTTSYVQDNYEETEGDSPNLPYGEDNIEDEEGYDNYDSIVRRDNRITANRNYPQSPEVRKELPIPSPMNLKRVGNRFDDYEDEVTEGEGGDTYLNEDEHTNKNPLLVSGDDIPRIKDRTIIEKSASGCHINFFTLPLNYETHSHNRFLDMDLNLTDSYQVASESFKNKILTLLNNSENESSKSTHITPKFTKPISEIEWLRNAGSYWKLSNDHRYFLITTNQFNPRITSPVTMSKRWRR
jgi:hypothetical protein